MATPKQQFNSKGEPRRNEGGLLVFTLNMCSGKNADGSTRRKNVTIYAKSMADAKRQAKELEVEFKHIDIIPAGGHTLGDLIKKYDSECCDDLTEQTKASYDGIVRNYIFGYFSSDTKVSDIKPDTVQSFMSWLKKPGRRVNGNSEPLSDKTVREIVNRLDRLLGRALFWRWIEYNPCTGLERPEVNRKRKDSYTVEEIEQILIAMSRERKELEESFDISRKYSKMDIEKRERRQTLRRLQLAMYEVYVLIALNTGARRSELAGLEFGDIEFNDKIIDLKRTSQHVSGKGIRDYDRFKNKTTEKRIGISEYVLEKIIEYKELLDRSRVFLGWEPSERLFISIKGGELNPAGGTVNGDCISQWWGRFTKRNGIRNLTLHEIRHTNVSVSLNRNVPLSVIREQVGHLDKEVTMNHYAHAGDEDKRQAAKFLDDVFSKYTSNDSGHSDKRLNA